MWWGFSQALDLLDEFSDIQPNKNEGDGDQNQTTCNVLLVGQCDCRHMLKTIAQKYRHKEDINVKLYVYEPLLENVARELLFTTIALEPPENLGIADKTHFFLELYGNSLIRPATAKYLTKISTRLLNVITNLNYAEEILPSISLKNLKYKERDHLEVIFKYWTSSSNPFNILTAWDERLRKQLGVRYDSRQGVYDWDYHMRYRPYGADILQIHEYKKFREKGIAFYFEDTDPCITNPTLASGIFSSGSKVLSYGYLGDIVTGPYVTFGLNCEDKDMFKKVGGQMRKSATQVTERNIMRIFHEIKEKTPFIPPPDVEEGCTVVMEDTSSKLKVQSKSESETGIKIKDGEERYNSLSTHNCEVIFMPTTALNDYSNKAAYENCFDLVFISQALVLKHIKPELFKMFKPNCKIIIDTPKFLLHYRKQDLEEFKNNLEKFMKDCNCTLLGTYNHEKDEFVRYRVEK